MRRTVLLEDIFVFHHGDYSGALTFTVPSGDAEGSRVEAECTYAELLRLAISRDPGDSLLLGEDREAGKPGIRIPMKAIFQFVAMAIEGQLIRMLEQGVAPHTREGVLALMQLKGAMTGLSDSASPEKTREAGPEHVDYNSEEFMLGFDEGKAGQPHDARHPEGTQAWFNYHEGWLMGDAEGKPYTPGA